MSDTQPDYHAVGSGDNARTLAVLRREGTAPTVIWMGGFRSDMHATKASCLDTWAHDTGHSFVRFDYSGHGESSGNFADGSIGQWLEDSLAVLDAFGGDAPLLVGSSMGGWLAVLVALRRKALGKPLKGLVLIAPAVDFTEKLMWDLFPDTVKDTVMKDGQWLRHSEYAPEPYPITRHLIEEGRNHLVLGKPLHLGTPVHILQGTHDPDVPMTHVLDFAKELSLDDAVITLVPQGDHRLSRPEDLALLQRVVAMMAAA